MAPPSTASLPQSGSIVSRWEMGESSGSRADSVGGLTLTDNNTVGSASGQFGVLAADLESGNSEYFSRSNGTAYDSPTKTVSGWIKLESLASTLGYSAGIISCVNGSNNGFELRLNSINNKIDFFLGGGANLISSTTVPSTGTWYFVTVAMNTTDCEIYINGVSEATDTSWASMTAGASTIYVGTSTVTSRYFDGLLQDVIVWDVKLSDSEVTDLYNAYFATPFIPTFTIY